MKPCKHYHFYDSQLLSQSHVRCPSNIERHLLLRSPIAFQSSGFGRREFISSSHLVKYATIKKDKESGFEFRALLSTFSAKKAMLDLDQHFLVFGQANLDLYG